MRLIRKAYAKYKDKLNITNKLINLVLEKVQIVHFHYGKIYKTITFIYQCPPFSLARVEWSSKILK